jgi:hypothetical protein
MARHPNREHALFLTGCLRPFIPAAKFSLEWHGLDRKKGTPYSVHLRREPGKTARRASGAPSLKDKNFSPDAPAFD